MALSTYWLPLCPAHWLKLFLTKWLAPSHHWQKSSLYPVAQASRLAQSIPPLVSHPSVWFWLALSRLTSSRSIWEKAAAWLAPATLLQMHMQINGWQPEKACQVDIHSFIQNQVSSYKLVICYKWICGKINIQDIPVMSYIFFFLSLKHSKCAFRQSEWQNASNAFHKSQTFSNHSTQRVPGLTHQIQRLASGQICHSP